MSDKINELPLEIEVDDVSNGDIYTAEDTQEHEVQKNDTVDIHTSEDEPIIIEVEETMGWAGGDSGVHSSLYGRDEPDQHPISAITGLSEKLSDIEALKSVQSNQFGFANYYKWANNESRSEYGYFVSLISHSETIAICNGRDIFGVTVPFAGFVGGQNEVKRGDDYALVATTGLVDVRCESTVSEGDYVVSNAYGIATKTDSGCGYKVIAIEDKYGVLYASISLGVQACVTDTIGKKLQHLDGRMGDAEINIAAAMNTANEAYNKAAESVSSNTSMSDQIADALVKVDDMATDIDNMGTQVSDIAAISAQAKAIATDAVISAESARNEAVTKANEALDKAGEIEKTVEPISSWEYKDPVTGETNTGATYFTEYVKNDLSTKAEMETVSKLAEDNKLLIEKNAENYTQMLSSIDKYSIGEYSQAYGLTVEQAKNILKEGMVYIPTTDHTEPLFAGGEKEMRSKAFYVWGGESWGSETLNSVWLGSNDPGNSYQYWYTALEDAEEGYEAHTLYINNDGKWVKVATLAGNVNNRLTSMIRQDVNRITMEVVNARGSSASLEERLDENGARVAMTASVVTELIDVVPIGVYETIDMLPETAESGAYYCVGTSAPYDVYKWNGTEFAKELLIYYDGAHFCKVNTASIVNAVNNDGESSISLNASKINFVSQAFNIFPSDNGVVASDIPNFSVDNNGNVNIKGTVTTESGYIGGFDISSQAIRTVADTSQIGYGWDSIYMDSCKSIYPTSSLWNEYFYDADNNQINRNYVYVGTDGIGTCRIEDYNEEYVCLNGELSDDNLVRAYMSNGKLYAEDADISGKISAKLGSIGGWEITENMIKSSDMYLSSSNSFEYQSLVPLSTNSPIRIGYGNILTPYLSNFLLLQDGSLYAKYADISGKIDANDGHIGGWSISGSMISKSNIYLNANDKVTYQSLITGEASPIRISIKNPSTPESCTFMILDDGSLYANEAQLKGTLTASAGSSIGKFVVGENGNLSLSTTENLSNVFTISKDYNSIVSNTTLSTGVIQLSRKSGEYTNYITLDCSSNSFPQLRFGYHGVYSGISFKQNEGYMLVSGADQYKFLIYDCGFGIHTGTAIHDGITGQIKVGNKYMRIDKGIITGISSSSYSGYTDFS